MKEFINQVLSILVTALVGIIAVAVKALGGVAVEFISSKKEQVLQEIKRGKHEEELKIALEVWNIVEEHFRINKVVNDEVDIKIKMFNELLLNKIPGLTEEQISYLRQTIAGELNKGKEVLISEEDK